MNVNSAKQDLSSFSPSQDRLSSLGGILKEDWSTVFGKRSQKGLIIRHQGVMCTYITLLNMIPAVLTYILGCKNVVFFHYICRQIMLFHYADKLHMPAYFAGIISAHPSAHTSPFSWPSSVLGGTGQGQGCLAAHILAPLMLLPFIASCCWSGTKSSIGQVHTYIHSWD